MSENVITCVVIRAFQDKLTKKHHKRESAYGSSDPKRIAFLQEEGFLGDQVSQEPPEDEGDLIKHVGGGYYELLNGEKVKGKEAALQMIKEIDLAADPNKQSETES